MELKAAPDLYFPGDTSFGSSSSTASQMRILYSSGRLLFLPETLSSPILLSVAASGFLICKVGVELLLLSSTPAKELTLPNSMKNIEAKKTTTLICWAKIKKNVKANANGIELTMALPYSASVINFTLKG